jgi:SAM-dependent methyltransferase
MKQTMDQFHPDAAAAEEIRIRTVYSKRTDRRLYSWFNSGHLFIVQERERRLLAMLRSYGCEDLKSKEILEIGCGNGHWIREFIKWGANPSKVKGIDLLDDRVAEAKQLCPTEVEIRCGSAAKLEFSRERFDLVFQSMVFTSILDSGLKQQVAKEMMRVVKRDGLILWYDYHVNNPWNSDVRGVRKKEIYDLFPGCRVSLRRVTLAPPVVRKLAPYSWMGCYLLEKIPWLCTHYLGAIQKPRQ